ncbi:hypothetical protein JMN32_10115 [Fulvivirga sp. 29W222]|uniref:Uncharacterized protein n=1 Tax=Fulvivirga marina TaxID=2494733 RepID=A0A937FXP5_9BACT|nr:hypothetical protein [Fulvivirga marina]MBL6446667.1 hypothetical protein [Fulvivirga marina]
MDLIFYGITILVVAFLLFLLLRAVMLWYWKINTIVQNQEDQKQLMKEQNRLLEQIYLLQGGHKIEYSKDSAEEIARKAKLFDESQG